MKKPVSKTRRTPVVYAKRFNLNEPIRIAIADDHKIFRQGLIELFSRYKEIEVVFEASNGLDAIAKLQKQPLDVMLLDLDMPIMNGIEAAGNISAKFPEIKILIISSCEKNETVLNAMNHGCHGFISKNGCISNLIDAILSFGKQFYYFNKLFKKTVLKRLLKGKFGVLPYTKVKLTPRESEVLILTAMELNAIEIAKKLFISKRTVEYHRENVIRKIGVKTVVGVGKYAVRHGLV